MADRPYLPFARPSVTDAERNAVLEVLDSGWLTTGAKAKAFETEFAGYVGARHAVALNSATAALHLALEALGVGPEDEVIVPTWTFAASAEVVAYLGARPVLIDVAQDTLNLTVEGVLAAVTPRTKAVIAVHIAGRPVAIHALVDALTPLGIAVVEDTAHAFPSRIGASGRMAGTIGRIGAYSFYATKTITTAEGGMLVTDDDSLAARARLMSLHGIGRDAWKRYAAGGSWYYEIEEAGFKYNLTDIAAALGLVQLARADELLAARRELVAWYRESFSATGVMDLVELPDDEPDGSHAWHLFIIRLRLDRLSVGRAAVISRMGEAGIGTSVHFIPLHLHPYYRRQGWRPEHFPVAGAEYERVISLPLWPGMTRDDIQRVVDALSAALIDERRVAALTGPTR
jgi:dTDP-4-amino-4,6-dideoxygalactose transaminase